MKSGARGSCVGARNGVSVDAAMGGTSRRSLRHDTVGLSTTEYVILLLVVACVTIAGWRILGTTAFERASSASGDMGRLDQGGAGAGSASGGGGGGGGSSAGSRPRTRLEDATADATPPPDPRDELTMPFALLIGAALLLVATFARRKKGGGKKSGADGSK